MTDYAPVEAPEIVETVEPVADKTAKRSTRRTGTRRKAAKPAGSAIREAIGVYETLRSCPDAELTIMAAMLGVEPDPIEVAVAKVSGRTASDEVGVIASIASASDSIEAMVEAAALVEDKASLRRAWTILDAASGTSEDLSLSRTHTISLAASLVRRVQSLPTETIEHLVAAAADLA